MKTPFKYRFEMNKGYIPSDKVRVVGIPYESIYIPELKEAKEYAKSSHLLTKDEKTKAIHLISKALWESGILIGGVENYYFNINHDGVDSFIKR